MAYSSRQIQELVKAEALRQGVDPALALAVAKQESAFNPNAVSSAGAQGVMQLMPATGEWLGVTDPFDPVQNIEAGVRYLKTMLGQFGNTEQALAAYNFGPGNVSRGKAYPSETVHYVKTVMDNQQQYSFEPYRGSPGVPDDEPLLTAGFNIDVFGKSPGGEGGSSSTLVMLILAGLAGLLLRNRA